MGLKTLAGAGLQVTLNINNLPKMLGFTFQVVDAIETFLNKKVIWYNLVLDNYTSFGWFL